MIDLKLIRDNPDKVRVALLKRGEAVNLDELLGLDKQRREQITAVEELKARRNQVTSEISALRSQNKPADALITEMKTVSSQIKALDLEVAELERKISDFMDALPNLPDEDVPAGGKESNEVS